jgi:hypothetical protein
MSGHKIDRYNAEGYELYIPEIRLASRALNIGATGFQIFQDGRYEAFAGGTIGHGGNVLPLATVRDRLFWSWSHLLVMHEKLGMSPLLVGISGLNLHGTTLGSAHPQSECSVRPNEVLVCPEIRLDTIEGDACGFAKKLESSLVPLFTSYGKQDANLSTENPRLWDGDATGT